MKLFKGRQKIIPKGIMHPEHDKCEDCFEIATQQERDRILEWIEKRMKIVKIPENVKYTMEEYDGVEWIAEKHRTWN